MHSAFSISLAPNTKLPHSCVRCFKRKVKCDRDAPCGACVKHNVECIFQPHLPRRKRGKVVKRDATLPEQDEVNTPDALAPTATTIRPAPQSAAQADVILAENVLRLPTPSSADGQGEYPSIKKTQLLQASGRTAFVDNSLWSRLAEELHDPNESDQNSSQENYEDTDDDEQFFALGASPDPSQRPQHPSDDVIFKLWQVYKRNVDPLVKIVHTPSFGTALEKAISNIDRLPRGFEALMFAIYSITILSLPYAECEQIFNEPREKLLSRYLSATRIALSRARFMSTTSLVVLQALFLYIFTIRETSEARLIFSLNGVALRVAEGMGLHRDGTSLGLSPFETEMRRRIWWQMKLHDWRTASLAGLNKYNIQDVHPDSPKPPININDNQIYPSMTQPPVSVDGATDMIFCLLRIEFGSNSSSPAVKMVQASKHGSGWDETWSKQGIQDQEQMIKEFQDRVESKYLRYCDPAEPLHLMAMIIARSAADIYRFVSHHPRKWRSGKDMPEHERNAAWRASIRLVEKFNMVQSNPQLVHLAWHSYYHMHWDAIIHMLDMLRATPLMPDADKAWQLIGTIYKNNPQIISNMKKPMHIAVASLSLKAIDARKMALETVGRVDEETPEFMAILREQRDLAKLQKTMRARQGEQTNEAYQQHNLDAQMAKNQTVLGSLNVQDNILEHGQPLISSHEDAAATISDDSFWFVQSFDDGPLRNGNGYSNYNLNDVQAPDVAMGDSIDQAFDWMQWDALMSNRNFDMTWS